MADDRAEQPAPDGEPSAEGAHRAAFRGAPAAVGDGAPLDPASEETIWTDRIDWRHFFSVILAASAAVIRVCLLLAVITSKFDFSGSTAFLIGLLVTLAAGLGVGGWVTVRVFKRRYRLTGQRLFVETGILSQIIDQTELIRVDDIRIRKTLVDRVFGLGSIDVLSTDATDKSLVIEGVKDVEQVAEQVRACMRALRSRSSLFVERL